MIMIQLAIAASHLVKLFLHSFLFAFHRSSVFKPIHFIKICFLLLRKFCFQGIYFRNGFTTVYHFLISGQVYIFPGCHQQQ